MTGLWNYNFNLFLEKPSYFTANSDDLAHLNIKEFARGAAEPEDSVTSVIAVVVIRVAVECAEVK